MIFYNRPNNILARQPKTKVLKAIETYLELPKIERPGAAWLIEMMEESQRQLGMEEAALL